MSRRYLPLDSLEIPTFWKVLPEYGNDPDKYGSIHDKWQWPAFAERTDHHKDDWATLGYVTAQSPFGQGTYLGFPRKFLVPATDLDIVAAFAIPHPFGGESFRPNDPTLQDISFGLIMHSALNNWYEDSSRQQTIAAVNNVSVEEVESEAQRRIRQYREIMAHWPEVCEMQRTTWFESKPDSAQLAFFYTFALGAYQHALENLT